VKDILKIGLGIVIGFACLGALCCGGIMLFGTASTMQTTTQEGWGQPLPTGTERPAPTPTPIPLGLTRANPAPLGQPVVNDQGIECTVLGVKHEFALEDWSPDAGNEFIAITVRLRNLASPDESISYFPKIDFQVVGSRGIIYRGFSLFSSGPDDLLEPGEFFGGSEVTGKIIREVGIGETDLVLIWNYGGWDSDVRYLSLEE